MLVLVVFRRVLTTTMTVAAVMIVVGVTADQPNANRLGELMEQLFAQDTEGDWAGKAAAPVMVEEL